MHEERKRGEITWKCCLYFEEGEMVDHEALSSNERKLLRTLLCPMKWETRPMGGGRAERERCSMPFLTRRPILHGASLFPPFYATQCTHEQKLKRVYSRNCTAAAGCQNIQSLFYLLSFNSRDAMLNLVFKFRWLPPYFLYWIKWTTA